VTRLVLGICLLLLALAAPAAPARAHATLVESTPGEGQVLADAPRMAHLRFNEPVSALVVNVIDGGGRMWSNLPVRAAGDLVEVELPRGLGDGSHVLSYRVVSGDGHPVGGSITFAIGHAGGRPARVDSGDAWVLRLLWLSRVLLYVGLFAGAGGAFFLAWVAGETPRKAARLVQAAIATGLAAAVLSVGYQGLDALAASLRSYWTRSVWAAGFGTSFGLTASVAMCALVSSWLGLVAPRPARRGFAAAGLLGAGLALCLSGHASAAGPWWLSRPAVFLHAACVAYWIGALAPLAMLLAGEKGVVAATVRRWSAGAVVAVAALVATGAVLTLVQVPAWAAVTETGYGRILIAKLIAVMLLLGLAAFNRLRLTPALAGHGRAARVLKRTVAAELALAAVIFALVALWRFTPPPRAVLPSAAPALSVQLRGDKGTAEVVLRPGRAGPVRAAMTLRDPDGRPLDAREVTLVLTSRAGGIEAIEREAARSDDGTWHAETMLPLAGRWQVRVDALVTDFDKLMLEGEVDVKR
jgi:copper transport protein